MSATGAASRASTGAVTIGLVMVAATAVAPAAAQPTVPFAAETELVGSRMGARDAAVWIHPEDASRSLVLAAADADGLVGFELDGTVRFEHRLDDPGDVVASVDVVYGFQLGGTPTDLVVLGIQGANERIDLHTVEPADRSLRGPLPGSPFTQDVDGACVYYDAADQVLFLFVATNGFMAQWRVLDDDGALALEYVREVTHPRWTEADAEVEWCAADDEQGQLYVSEETSGVWKVPVQPDREDDPVLVAGLDGEGLMHEVEDVAVYYHEDGGYLLASGGSDDHIAVYERTGDHELVFRFTVDDGTDGCHSPDGIGVSEVGLNEDFPGGVFLCEDGENQPEEGTQNFKLVSWGAIAEEGGLDRDSRYDPRTGEYGEDPEADAGADAGTGGGADGGTGVPPDGGAAHDGGDPPSSGGAPAEIGFTGGGGCACTAAGRGGLPLPGLVIMVIVVSVGSYRVLRRR